MSAAERLAAAFHAPAAPAHPAADCATVCDMLDADPDLAQDIEDGAALRRLREAGGTWRMGNVRTAGRTIGYVAEAWSYVTGEAVKVLGHDDEDMMPPKFDTIAEAADACQIALKAKQ